MKYALSYDAIYVEVKADYVPRRFRLSRKQARRLIIRLGVCAAMLGNHAKLNAAARKLAS